MCLISWERTQKGDPRKLFQGEFWGQKRGPQRAIFGHKKFSLLFFPALNKIPQPRKSGKITQKQYPLTQNYYENNSLRLIFRNNFEGFCAPEMSRKEKNFKELRVRFVILVACFAVALR